MFPRVCLYSASQWVPLKMVSILVSARKASVCCGVSLHSALWFRASFPSPVISCLPRRTSRGNASNHLSCKHTAPRLFFFASFAQGKENRCKCHAKQASRQAAHLAAPGTSTLQSFHQKWRFVCSSFSLLPPSFPLFLSSERIEEIPWYIVVRNV